MKFAISSLLGRQVVSMHKTGGGRNGKVYRVLLDNSELYAAKVYFRHLSDERNRMQVEFSSLQFLWKHGVRNISRPIAMDPERGFAIYEFVDGSRIAPRKIAASDIDVVVEFLAVLARCADKKDSRKLSAASEACFSAQDIANVISRRLAKLSTLEAKGPPYDSLRRYMKEEFIPTFDRILDWIQKRLRLSGTREDSAISRREMVLSPSDFGFHNAVRRRGGDIVFLDFEYFGWDDPAKMVSDFLLHPGMDLSLELKNHFFGKIVGKLDEKKCFSRRMDIVYPLVGLNWCLIVLNEFVPEHLVRRTFAGREKDVPGLLERQLSKSARILDHVRSHYERFPYSG